MTNPKSILISRKLPRTTKKWLKKEIVEYDRNKKFEIEFKLEESKRKSIDELAKPIKWAVILETELNQVY